MALTRPVSSLTASTADWHRRGLVAYVLATVLVVGATALEHELTLSTVLVAASVALGVVVAVAAARVLGVLGRPRSLLLWPVAAGVLVAVLSFPAPATAVGLAGLYVLAFLYVGLCQPPGTGLTLLVPAAIGYLVMVDPDVGSAVIRLPVALLIWGLVSELPSHLIAALSEQTEGLRESARTDPLTGLLNRSELDERLAQAGPDSAVTLIDLDYFKHYNDTYGHLAGDEVLKHFAADLRCKVRAGDAVFRYGGEEFLVIFSGTGVETAARRIREVAASWPDHEAVGFSAGVVPGGPGALRRADELLYEAKAAGRGRVLVAGSTATRTGTTPVDDAAQP